MAIFNMIEENEATGKVKEIFEDIKQKRNIKSVNNFWKMLANEPETLDSKHASQHRRTGSAAATTGSDPGILTCCVADLEKQLIFKGVQNPWI